MKCGILPVSLLVLLASMAAAAEVEIAVVDLEKVFHSHPGTAAAEARVREARTGARKAFIEKTNALKAVLQEHQEILLALEGGDGEAAAAKRAEAKNLLEKARVLEAEVADFKTAQEADLERRFLEEKNRIMDAIVQSIREFNAEGKYDLIIDRSAAAANGMPTLVDVRGLDDITSSIIQRLQ